MTPQELAVPLTALEKAKLAAAASTHNHQLTAAGVDLLRRALFELDVLKSRAQQQAGPYSIGSDRWSGLSKLTEECGEVLQIVGKIIGANGDDIHFSGIDLREKLAEELADLSAAIDFVAARNELDIHKRIVEKFDQFNEWHDNNQKGAKLCTCISMPPMRNPSCPLHGS